MKSWEKHIVAICILHAIHRSAIWCSAEFGNTKDTAPVDPELSLYLYGHNNTDNVDDILSDNHRRNPRKVVFQSDTTDPNSLCSDILTKYLNKCIDHKAIGETEDESLTGTRRWHIYDLLTPEEKQIEYSFLIKEVNKILYRIIQLNIRKPEPKAPYVPKNKINPHPFALREIHDASDVLPSHKNNCKQCEKLNLVIPNNHQIQEKLSQFTESYLGILELLTQQQRRVNPFSAQRGAHTKRKRSTPTVTIPLPDLWKLILASAGIKESSELSYSDILKQANIVTTTAAPISSSTTSSSATSTRGPQRIERITNNLIALHPQKQFENLVDAVESFRPYHELYIPDYNFIVQNQMHLSDFQKIPKVSKEMSRRTTFIEENQQRQDNLFEASTVTKTKYVPFSH